MKGISDSLHIFCKHSLTYTALLFHSSLRGIIPEIVTFLLPDVKLLAKSTIDLLHSCALFSEFKSFVPHEELCDRVHLHVYRVWHNPSCI